MPDGNSARSRKPSVTKAAWTASIASEFCRGMSASVRLGAMFLQLPPRYSPDRVDDLLGFRRTAGRSVWRDAPSTGSELYGAIPRPPVGRALSVAIDTSHCSLDGDRSGKPAYRLCSKRGGANDVPLPDRSTSIFCAVYHHPKMDKQPSTQFEWAATSLGGCAPDRKSISSVIHPVISTNRGCVVNYTAVPRNEFR
jgi:hypothetical protein